MAARMEQLIQSETPAPDIGTDVPRLDVDPFEVRHLREPYSIQRQLRDAGPVVWLARHGTYGAAGFAEIQQILQDPAHFSSAAGVGLAHLRRPGAWREPSPLVESDPPAHTVIRRTMDQILAPSVIRQWRARFTSEAERLCDSFAGPPVWYAVNMLRALERLPLELTPA